MTRKTRRKYTDNPVQDAMKARGLMIAKTEAKPSGENHCDCEACHALVTGILSVNLENSELKKINAELLEACKKALEDNRKQKDGSLEVQQILLDEIAKAEGK